MLNNNEISMNTDGTSMKIITKLGDAEDWLLFNSLERKGIEPDRKLWKALLPTAEKNGMFI